MTAARCILRYRYNRAKAIAFRHIDATVANRASRDLFAQFSEVDLERTLDPLPKDLDLRCIPPLKPSQYRSKRFKSCNRFVGDRSDRIPGKYPGRVGWSSGNNLLYGDAIRGLSIDPHTERPSAARKGGGSYLMRSPRAKGAK